MDQQSSMLTPPPSQERNEGGPSGAHKPRRDEVPNVKNDAGGNVPAAEEASRIKQEPNLEGTNAVMERKKISS